MKKIAVPYLYKSRTDKPEVPDPYLHWIREAGYDPVVISEIDEIADTAGMVLVGGADVTPELFGDFNIASSTGDRDVDEFWLDAVGHAITHNIPVFGFCRGHQFLFYAIRKIFPTWWEQLENYRDLTFCQHMKQHSKNPTVWADQDHAVVNIDGSIALQNSYHHQAALINKQLWFTLMSGDKLRHINPLAVVQDFDENYHVLEAVSYSYRKWVGKSVQWHPEVSGQVELLQELFK